MDHLYKFLGVCDLENKRVEQIKRQEDLDRQVANYVAKCPHIVANYYLAHREISRRQQSEFIKSSFIDKLDQIKSQLRENDQYYDELQKSLVSHDFCQRDMF